MMHGWARRNMNEVTTSWLSFGITGLQGSFALTGKISQEELNKLFGRILHGFACGVARQSLALLPSEDVSRGVMEGVIGMKVESLRREKTAGWPDASKVDASNYHAAVTVWWVGHFTEVAGETRSRIQECASGALRDQKIEWELLQSARLAVGRIASSQSGNWFGSVSKCALKALDPDPETAAIQALVSGGAWAAYGYSPPSCARGESESALIRRQEKAAKSPEGQAALQEALCLLKNLTEAETRGLNLEATYPEMAPLI